MNLLTYKLKLFRAARIDVYLSIWFIIFALFRLMKETDHAWGLMFLGVLWVSILLHEFGHCFGARSVGGDAEEILLWPLGGLASCDAARRPWPQFVTTICGPLVNAVLAAVFFGVSQLLSPPTDFRGGYYWTYWAIQALWGTNLALLVFNVIPAFPMDGGRLLQTILWPKLGYKRSMRIAIYLAFLCGGGMIVGGLAGIVAAVPELFGIGLWVLLSSYQELRVLREEEAADAAEPWRQSLDPELELDAGPGPIQRFLDRRAEAKKVKEEHDERSRADRLDEVLKRVSEVGIGGITPAERAFLDEESERARRRKPS